MAPCPFCGGKAHMSGLFNVIRAYCPTCHTEQPEYFRKDEARAITAWNRRSPALRVELERGRGAAAGAAPRPSSAEHLLALADRCEREEASQELSDAIAFAVGWRLCDAIWWKPPGEHWDLHPPAFTTSLDAARSLLPDGWLIEALSEVWQGELNAVRLGSLTAGREANSTRACTIILALCAASLRALAAEQAPPDEVGPHGGLSEAKDTPNPTPAQEAEKIRGIAERLRRWMPPAGVILEASDYDLFIEAADALSLPTDASPAEGEKP